MKRINKQSLSEIRRDKQKMHARLTGSSVVSGKTLTFDVDDTVTRRLISSMSFYLNIL